MVNSEYLNDILLLLTQHGINRASDHYIQFNVALK